MVATSFGRYQLLDLLGRGGMGEVYRAHDTATQRTVAIKVLPPHLATDPDFQRRFRREARIAASLNDPHVVPIHSYGEIDGRLYVDMRLVEGRDLHTLIKSEGGRLGPERAVAIIRQVASALDSAHRADLVHRDVKPSNILVTDDDFAYLIDFGIARGLTDTAMTSTGHTVGTMAYMAPERFSGTTDARADVYSLACVLHECLTGSRPYPGDSLEQQLAGHLNAPPPRPSTIRPGIPAAFDAVIARGMAKDPNARYQTGAQLADAAQAALTPAYGGPHWAPGPQAPMPNPATAQGWNHMAFPPRPQEAGRRRTYLVVGGSVAAVAVIVAAVLIMVVTQSHGSITAATTTPASRSPESTTTSATTETSPHPADGAPLPPFTPSAEVGANCQYPASTDPAAKPVKPPRTGKVPTDPAQVNASMVTSQGPIGLVLANNESPCTVNSFVSLMSQSYFDNTKCHRLTTSPVMGVLQCGDPNGDGTGGPGYQFADEYPADQYPPGDPAARDPVVYPRGTLAMANAGPNTNGGQFFMVYADSPLPPQYTVFGTIQADGLATLDKIAKAGVAGGGEDGAPAIDVTIESIRLD